MNIKDISYFIEVVKERNFTKAASNLYISQPALSKSIKNLEKDLNVQLIDRKTKYFELTQEGEIFYERANESLGIINQELKGLQDAFENKKQILRFGLPPVVGSIFFAPIIIEFNKENPDIEFQIIEEGSNNIKTKIENRELEIGVVVLPVDSKDIMTIEIISNDIVAVVSDKHHLSECEKINLLELKKERFIVFNEQFRMYDKTINACRESGFSPNIVLKTSQWDFIMDMIAHDHGVGIMPRPIVERFKQEGVKMISIERPQMKWEIGIIVDKGKYYSKTIQKFIEYTIKYMDKHNA